MNHTHLPRSLIILLFILVGVTFFVGTLHTFAPARAATVLADLAPTSTSMADFPPPGPTPTPPPASLLPPPTEDATLLQTPPPTYTPNPTALPDYTIYADTTGVIALAILLVVVVLVGMAFGQHNRSRKKTPKQ